MTPAPSPRARFSPAPFLVLASLVLAYLVWRGLAVEISFVVDAVLWWGLVVLITVVVVAPCVWRATRRQSGDVVAVQPRLLAVAALLFLAYFLVHRAPGLAALDDLQFAWQGKMVVIVAMAALVAMWARLSPSAVGLTLPGWSGWWPVLVVTATAVPVAVLATAGGQELPRLTTETILFQATMPSVEEELLWRGVLWVLVLQALPQTRRFGGQGWALLATTVSFGVPHGLVVDNGLTLDIPVLVFTSLWGLLLGWIRIRSGSVLPAMVAHSGINLTMVLVPWLLT